MDVSNSVDVTNPAAVAVAMQQLMELRYPGHSFAVVHALVNDLQRLYEGRFPGFHGCEVAYHNLQHVLDVSLAMARLLNGHDKRASQEGRPDEALGPHCALVGLVAAIFHDAGYIRRANDHLHDNGAAYTRVHVNRSARWLRDYLPSVNLGKIAASCARIVQFTNCNRHPQEIDVRCYAEQRLGELIGSADLIAQLADVAYIEKCRKYLYEEFVISGVASAAASEGYTGKVYRSAQELIESTPEFIRWVLDQRLEVELNGAYHYATDHFEGSNLYMEAIRFNYEQLEYALREQTGT
ncbi:MAG: hypothetical protein ACK5ME_01340 [Parahaliea sp.]